MRLWTLHPKYLDSRGLVALWREALLAQAVLSGRTRGYRHHPQLLRFSEHDDPVRAIGCYLVGVLAESQVRGYRFDGSKILAVTVERLRSTDSVPVDLQLREQQGQLLHEWRHLLQKLALRSPDWYAELRSLTQPDPHPIFSIIPGPVQPWEGGLG